MYYNQSSILQASDQKTNQIYYTYYKPTSDINNQSSVLQASDQSSSIKHVDSQQKIHQGYWILGQRLQNMVPEVLRASKKKKLPNPSKRYSDYTYHKPIHCGRRKPHRRNKQVYHQNMEAKWVGIGKYYIIYQSYHQPRQNNLPFAGRWQRHGWTAWLQLQDCLAETHTEVPP